MTEEDIMDMQYIIESIINQRKLVKEIIDEENTSLI